MICKCCGGALQVIGESVSEMRGRIPTQLHVTAPRVRNTSAGGARRPCKRRLQSGQLLAVWQRRRCCRRCWSANIATTRRCFGNRKSSRVMASIFRDDRRSPDGSAAPAGGSKLSTNGLPRMYLPRTAGPNTWFRTAQWRRAITLADGNRTGSTPQPARIRFHVSK